MRNRLQYLYSITVFLGALVTAYLMMSNDIKVRPPYREVRGPQLMNEAGVDPALGSLFEVEKGLWNIDPSKDKRERVPSQVLPQLKQRK